MATDLSYLEYLMERLAAYPDRYFRKMFGEYMIYLSDLPVILVCDNTAFVKKLPALSGLLEETGLPYQGAKEHYILDFENEDSLAQIIDILIAERRKTQTKKTRHEK